MPRHQHILVGPPLRHHINLHAAAAAGEFDFSEQQIAPTFDMEAILHLFKP